MATYNFQRQSIIHYYKTVIEFNLDARSKSSDDNLNVSLNLNTLLLLACYIESSMEEQGKILLGYHRLIFKQCKISDFPNRKSMNMYFNRIEKNYYQKVSRGTGIDNYNEIFELLTGISFKKSSHIQDLIEPISVLFQLRNVLAHGKEISGYLYKSYETTDQWEENFFGGYKRAEDFLLKKGIVKEKFTDKECGNHIFTNDVTDYFYSIGLDFTERLKELTTNYIKENPNILVLLDQYNEKNGTSIKLLEYCSSYAYHM